MFDLLIYGSMPTLNGFLSLFTEFHELPLGAFCLIMVKNQRTNTQAQVEQPGLRLYRGQTSMFQLGRLVLFNSLHHHCRIYSRDQSNSAKTGHRELLKS